MIAKVIEPSLTLVEVADQLRHREVDAVVSGYRERSVSLKRNIVLIAVICWALYWSRGAIVDPPDGWQHLPLGQVLPIEATKVLPWLLSILPVSLIWMFLVRSDRIKETEFIDGASAVANHLIIGVMLWFAWNLCLAAVTTLPLISIIIGARFGKKYFCLSILMSLVVVGISAPENYWIKRPAFAVFAVVLLAGLPMTVNKLLSTLWAISAQAVRSREAQNRFIATMSHELRTPLNTVINATALIDKSSLPPDQQEILESAEVNATVLLGRVNEVLDVAAIDRGQMAIANNPFRLSEVLQTVQGVCTPQAHAKGVQFEIDGAGAFPEIFMGDPARIEQTVSNLVTNAIKFTPAGGEVVLKAERGVRDIDGRLHLKIQVMDTGIGIPDAEKLRVFDPFRKSHQMDLARAQGGVGLGLYIVKAVAEQMGGKVVVTDNPYGGTIFTWHLSLPVADREQAIDPVIPLREALAAHKAVVAPIRCLVFEDNLPNRNIIRWLMQLAGHEVAFAEPGADPVDAMRAAKADAVLLDLHMPDRSGWDVLTDVKARFREGTSPLIIMISADSDPKTIEDCLALGAVAYLTKPIDPVKLLSTLQIISANATRGVA